MGAAHRTAVIFHKRRNATGGMEYMAAAGHHHVDALDVIHANDAFCDIRVCRDLKQGFAGHFMAVAFGHKKKTRYHWSYDIF